MVYIILGCLGFLIVHLFDIVALKRLPAAKPIIWFSGIGLFIYAIVMICLQSNTLILPAWSTGLGWALLSISFALLLYALFINLPFIKTYISTGVPDELVKTRMYALVRHPGVIWFVLLIFALILVSKSSLLLIAAPIFILLDIVLVVFQDKYFFGRMFDSYDSYRGETPMLIPSRESIGAFTDSVKRTQKQKPKPKSRHEEVDDEIVRLIREGSIEEVWQRCCGFIDLSLKDFMDIQRRLLSEQLDFLKGCELGRYIMNGATPSNLEEFRESVPLTTYDDYAPYLLERREDVLPEKPALWQYTSGKSGEYPYRWAPVTARQLEETKSLIFALTFFSSCKYRNDVVIKEHDRILYGMAPPPYATGTLARIFPYQLFNFLPPVEDAEKMSFEDRIEQGFKMALNEGLDICLALSSVALAIGDRFGQKGKTTQIRSLLKRPKVLLRLARGLLRSKLARRSLSLKDLWSIKGLITFGMDSSIYKEKLKNIWGTEPLEFHGCTEANIIATQTWDRQGMTFIPHLNLLEFIPEEEIIRARVNPGYQPATILLDDVKPGKYELVITSFHGGPFIRYRLGHLIEITSLHNEQLNIDIPQMVFLTRVDDQIDLAGFTRLTEKIIWQSIENTGFNYKDWTVRKEVKEQPTLHLYIELIEDGVSAQQLANSIHNELKKLDTPYSELESFTGLKPLEVTLLPSGTFSKYKSEQRQAGADLTNQQIQHINPSDAMLDTLLLCASSPVPGAVYAKDTTVL
jgi:protein-S-isoprenylcysteine O-methyltransferase Ste14